ncbi:hypothetical protein COV88_03445 [Candidatus Saccharibacteria bacterium CG11_big_fil_rev_8_21_14_0_20_41_19]|nr:hypothetical protein [Candidatus Saccharibacteria bacterium]OIP86120.1 MAG: hypothetical protein AUK57_01475 [Candidatus Saccharibacteria bacterium CG2_30_41_52]PIQ70645.1 MAG: hypothetical protein COV88_03445 [Candidatus Saccharibacteria bacterium CG11_big_fil_rev_8_21_14_0_20_41_19]PIZ59564.1 MAG: hypothetical protein COY18_02970 [Candidatus Saccharibacteria bacterium CG_4_10_14_0_2_um_filter_41_11]PJC29746.1 MAG: hypothetical protein CO052_01680 [Candidatus Saccharibacteria bacterium CG_4
MTMAKKNPIVLIKKRITSYLDRRPHRSFRPTRRRDYNRSLNLPGYWAFTAHVNKTLWSNRKIFILLAVTYAILTVLLVGIASQDMYATLTDTLRTTGTNVFTGDWGEMGRASLLFAATVTGSITQTLTETQQIYSGLLGLLAWLTSVWLLRNILAGHKVKLRDGLYSAGSPLLSTFLVTLLLLVQMLPFALALIGYSAATATGLLAAGGIESMLFWIAAALLTVTSLYLMTSTVFALIIVTIPGMYPLTAIKTAGDLVIGRRLRILKRLIWASLYVSVIWILIMIPIILIDLWIKGLWSTISWVPTIPIVMLALSSSTIVWVSSYVYLLYRKVIDDDANPA